MVSREEMKIMKRPVIYSMVCLWLLTLTAAPTPTGLRRVQSIGPVPAKYKALYTRLEGRLATFTKKLDSISDGSAHPVIMSAGLVMANPNSGDALLTPQAYELSVRFLDSLHKLGVKGVALDINFPLLDPNFRGTAKSNEYLSFYRKLISEIRKRDLSAVIEVQPIFPDFSRLPVRAYYQKLTLETYKTRVLAMLKAVAEELKPDYLTVANEPDTAAGNTGLPLDKLEVALDEVRFLLSGLKDLGLNNIRYGAGFGNWQKDYQVWAQGYSDIPKLDFLNVHIYPADGDLLDRVLTISDIAKNRGKRLSVHESWLYKWQAEERIENIAAMADIYARDSYSFWQPLDIKFIEILFKLGQIKKFDFISLFWSCFFFTYFDYDEVKDLPGKTLMKESILNGAEAAREGKLTVTGEAYRKLITQGIPLWAASAEQEAGRRGGEDLQAKLEELRQAFNDLSRAHQAGNRQGVAAASRRIKSIWDELPQGAKQEIEKKWPGITERIAKLRSR
jgi:hypothetical protein